MGKVEEMVEEKVEVLKPCPLCGSNDLLLKDFAGWELFCCNCELSLVLADDPNRDGVVARWNDRSNTRQRAEQAAVTVAERARRREMADIIAAEHRRRKLVKVIMGAEKERAGKLSDDKLIEHFVTTVLNGLPTGSYEEALAEELVDRFSAVVGIEVKQ